MRLNSKMLNKIVLMVAAVGTAHISTLSFGPGFYEPKISASTIKKIQNKQK